MTTNLRALFLLQEGLVFLNHGSFGACPEPVFRAYQDWQLKLERQPVAFLDQQRDLFANLKKSRTAVAQELGADTDDVVGVANATAGLNAVARSIPLQPGDQILTTDHEYNALNNTWQFVAGCTGAQIVLAEIAVPMQSAEVFTRTLIDAMTDRTKILFLSHVTSPTALVFPVEAVILEAKRRGIITIIDGAHAPGLIDLNLNELGADYYSGNCHKWMMAPKGAAFLWAHRDAQQSLEPNVVSHGWVSQNGEPDQRGAFGRSRFIDCFETQGTNDPAAWLAVPDAIAFKKSHDWDQVRKRCAELTMATAVEISRRANLPLLATPEFLAPQMISMQVPDCDVMDLKNKLLDDYHVEVPVFRWNERCIVRVSMQGYNTSADASCLVDALSDIFKFSGH